MEKLKKIQKIHHYIVDWHIPKKNKEDIKDIQSEEITIKEIEKMPEKDINFFWY